MSTAAPTEWGVRNGAFIGYCQVQGETAKIGLNRTATVKEDQWLFFTIDLRQVTHLRQHSDEHPEWTELYNGNNAIATVNAPASALAEPWLKTLHAFERIPTTPEARADAAFNEVAEAAPPFNVRLSGTPGL